MGHLTLVEGIGRSPKFNLRVIPERDYHASECCLAGGPVTNTLEPLHFEIEQSTDPATGALTTTFHCHGRLLSSTAADLKDEVRPLIGQGGHIVLDFADLSYVDSSGLGVLAGLKASAIREGYCRLIIVNIAPRVKDLLRLTNLLEMFTS